MIHIDNEVYQQLLSDQLAKQEGEEIIAELEYENTLLKVANAEMRDKLDTVASMVKQGFGDDNCSFYDLLRKIERLV